LPALLLRAFAGVEAILHGGDVVRLGALEPLMALAPVYVVGGNNDDEEVGARCGYRRALVWRGWRIGLVHGDTGYGRTTPARARSVFRKAPPRYESIEAPRPDPPVLADLGVAAPPGRPRGAHLAAPVPGPFDVIVFGHSHIPVCHIEDGLLLLNPGSPTERRQEPRASFALLETGEDGLSARMVYL
jgi:hypothetical protein